MNQQPNSDQQSVMARVYAYILSLPDPDDGLTETPTTQPRNSEGETEVQQ